jgi:hypothetical protein
VGKVWQCWIFVFPNVFPWSYNFVSIKFLMGSPTCSPSLSHILCHKFHSCNLNNQPQGGDYNMSILIFGTVESFIYLFTFIYCDGLIEDAHYKRKIIELWVSPTMSHNTLHIPRPLAEGKKNEPSQVHVQLWFAACKFVHVNTNSCFY